MELQYRSLDEVRRLSDDDLGREVVEIQARIDRDLAEQAKLVSEWDARKLWASDGSRSCSAHYARETGLSPDDAKRIVFRAKRLRWMPLTVAAFENGSLSSSRVDLLARARCSKVGGLFARDEADLVDQVTKLSFSDALRAVRYWSAHADEYGTERRGQKLLEQRTAYISRTYEGSVDLRGLFDPVGGEIFANELERLEKQLFEADWAEAKAIHGEDVCVERLKRTSAQRRCDALVLMAERSATAGVTKKAKPLFSVVAGKDTFKRICELSSGTVLSPGQLVPWLGESNIERIVFDGPSRILDLGEQRSFRGALRRAIEIRDRHCQHSSGCDVPARRCDVDHSVAYSRGGQTNQMNGKLLCPAHNRAKGSGPP